MPPRKLTWAIVNAIRADVTANPSETNATLALRYGLHPNRIGNLITGMSWKDPNYKPIRRKGKLTWAQVCMIRQEQKDGVAQSLLAKRYGVSPASISHIINAKQWRKEPSGKLVPTPPQRPRVKKLKPDEVEAIRRYMLRWMSFVSHRYDIHESAVWNAIRGRQWRQPLLQAAE